MKHASLYSTLRRVPRGGGGGGASNHPMGFDWSSLPRPRSARLSVRRSADVGPCAVSYGADADAYAPARSVVAALGVSTKVRERTHAAGGEGTGQRARGRGGAVKATPRSRGGRQAVAHTGEI